MANLDQKINEHFPGLVVRKDLVKTVKGNAIVPSYVLEYLLVQYCATNDEASIQSGIETVKEILRKHYVHRNEAGLVRSTIKEKGRHKVIDKIGVALNEKADAYEATFSNLGIKKVLVAPDIVKKHPKLLVGGVWCIADIEYEFFEDTNVSPWILGSLKPIQLSRFDFDAYLAAREKFSADEWIDLLMQSMGFNPEKFSRRGKLLQIMRLVPFCERNYNLIELGPKGTGKSHIFSEFSPHGILISGAEVTVPKLFVNNASGKIGLVGYWDVVAFDEFAGKKKSANKSLVDILKNYMANKSFSRGVETLGAEASMVYVGNTQHTLQYMLKHSDLFDELPEQYHDSAFLDRLHFYVPGWEVDILRSEMFSDGYGFVVDYLAEILRNMRDHDLSHVYTDHFSLSSDISTRDRDSINKTFSGLMKILFPSGEATKDQIENILRFAIEGRKRIKDQLMRMDSTYAEVQFRYSTDDGEEIAVRTLEEEEHPNYYYHDSVGEPDTIVETTAAPSEKGPGNLETDGVGETTGVDYQALINGGENHTVEFKSSLRWDADRNGANKLLEHAVAKGISAFMNSKGGTLLIGVDDDGQILGIENDYKIVKNNNRDGMRLQLTQVINQYLGKQFNQYTNIEIFKLADKDVCAVDVQSSDMPVFLKDGNKDEFYIRASASSQPMSIREANEYIKTHWKD